ncbi:hypothetical protein B0H12DRAFT_622045 [Mycena haematopus]|nr:hypothetical protein B0H12DRAFT_622045 [Mycena haematopus]
MRVLWVIFSFGVLPAARCACALCFLRWDRRLDKHTLSASRAGIASASRARIGVSFVCSPSFLAIDMTTESDLTYHTPEPPG